MNQIPTDIWNPTTKHLLDVSLWCTILINLSENDTCTDICHLICIMTMSIVNKKLNSALKCNSFWVFICSI